MEQAITEFIHTEAGFITALVLIFLGLSDLGSGYYLMRYRPDLIPLPANKLERFMMAIYFISSFFVLVGGYMLYLRA